MQLELPRSAPRQSRNQRKSETGAAPWGPWYWYLICGLIALMFLFPLVMAVFMALKSPTEAVSIPPTYYPHHPTLANFARLNAFGSGIAVYLGNSVEVAVGTVVGTVVLSTLAGFGFGRFAFPGSAVLFVAVLGTLMVPFQAILTPLYLILHNIGLQNSLLGLTLVYITFQLPFAIFLMRNAFAQVPAALHEAATLDGCGVLRTLWYVMLPLVAPGMATVALFAFFSSWNEFLAALILLSDDAKFTLPLMLQDLVTERFGALDWSMLEVGVVLAMAPCVVIFLLLQRYYVSGLVAGSGK